ncbi:MAG: FAD:protein FMN transferase ApbE [Acidobacteria bacterium]|nr:FAD:protein FMN transferase ApbE [Acidobacteriota bacterium]
MRIPRPPRPAPRAFAAALAVLLLLHACGGSAPSEQAFAGEAMGTTWSVKVRSSQPMTEEAAATLQASIELAIEQVNQKMSTYLATSELSRFNDLPGPATMEASADTIEVFAEARRIGGLSDGVFDITVGPLVNAWGFGPGDRREDLDDAELARLRALTGWDKIEIDTAAKTLHKTIDGVYCDLSAIAKGYAVDKAAEALEGAGHADYMVEIGGEVRVRGVNRSGEPWRIAVEKPDPAGRTIQRVLPLHDIAMATSGDYRNYFEKDGERYSHEIDPRTGRPVGHRTASVTVLDPSCATADAWATALIVLGEEAGYGKAVELELPALFLVREGEAFVEKPTPAFEGLFPEPQ